MSLFKNKQFLFSLISSTCLLIASLCIHFYAGTYATERASNSVTDIVLSNTPVFDFDGIFIYGSILFWFFIGALLLRDPKRIPFVFKSIAIFVLIRSVFITLTHIGPFPDQAILPPDNLIRYITFGGDLFFSGYTGLPFLMALVFWKQKYIRVLCIASAIFFGIVVLLAHLHYSIDVLSAFFITYTIYSIAEFLFKRDRRLFYEGLPALSKSL
jgi:hypothetical protein